ncbi:unnamed protein product, partial [Mycena citricolor]
ELSGGYLMWDYIDDEPIPLTRRGYPFGTIPHMACQIPFQSSNSIPSISGVREQRLSWKRTTSETRSTPFKAALGNEITPKNATF